jgi:DNA-binding MarR family transcriptional regulator
MELILNDNTLTDLQKSISEEALREFDQSDDSLAGVIGQYEISVSDFMLLSLVSDQNCLDMDQLGRALGLDDSAIALSAARLSAAGLLGADNNALAADRDQRICATEAGHKLAARILGSIVGDG